MFYDKLVVPGRGRLLVMTALLLAIGGIFTAAPAQESPPPLIDLKKGVAFELSPHTGAMGGSGMFGLRLGMNYGALNLELAGEQVIGESANLYPIAVNFMLNLATRGRLFPYGVAGGGLFLTVPTNAIGSGTVSTMGVNFGGGTRLYLTKSFGFRLEVKQYITSVSDELRSSSELLIFQEISLGATFMFR